MNQQQLLANMTATPLSDGKPVNIFRLANSAGVEMLFMDLGATWLSCQLPLANGEQREVLLSVANMEQHQAQTAYFGAAVGRYANRIAKGQFNLADKCYQLPINNGPNSLHGGDVGFDARRWDAEQPDARTLVFKLSSVDGDQGYPGNMTVEVCYHLADDNSLEISYQAQTDQACPVNLTNHAYFNLMGADSGELILDHSLQLAASYYLPTDNDLIPTGELKSVSDTSFDFRTAKSVGEALLSDDDQRIAGGYDHAFLFTDFATRDSDQPVAILSGPDGQVTLEVITDKPGIQFYSGNFLPGTPSRYGGEYAKHQGLALETQLLPDSPNQDWPHQSCILQPGETYHSKTCYRFYI